MNFDDAIAAHVKWKIRLGMFIEGHEKLDAAVVCKDNQCDLGKWIYNEGQSYAAHEEYTRLRDEHAKFHQAAADVVTTVDRGQREVALTMIENGSVFMNHSQAVVSAIIKLRRKVESPT